MKKVALGALVAGFLIGAGSAQAGTLEFTDSIDMNFDWLDNEPLTLEVAKYNGRGNLLSIFIEVSSEARGTYTLTNLSNNPTNKNQDITYGTQNDDVGTSVKVFDPSKSIFLNPTPMEDIGSGTLIAKQSLTKNISTSETTSVLIEDSSLFKFFTGVGNVVFNAFAENSTNVNVLGKSFSSITDVAADARLRIVYEYEDAPPPSVDIPEPGMLAGLLAFGSLGLAANRRKAS
jgi:hypothetical protein